MSDKYENALDAYYEKFKEHFPTTPFSSYDSDEMVDAINNCISKGKDVYELGYLDLNLIY